MKTVSPLIVPLPERQLLTGVVAMFDALGFKGIWQRFGITDVLSRFERIGCAAEAAWTEENRKLQCRIFGEAASYGIEVRFLSDTVIVTASADLVMQGTNRAFLAGNEASREQHLAQQARQAEAYRKAYSFGALRAVLEIVSATLLSALSTEDNEPPLNYRGAIAYGSYLVVNNLLVGQAVDDCAGLYEKPKGAFIVLHETAEEFYNECQAAGTEVVPNDLRAGGHSQEEICAFLSVTNLVRYDVPFKEGSRASLVLDPLHIYDEAHREGIAQRMVELIVPPENAADQLIEDIRIKSENTRTFLDHLLQVPTE